MTIRRGEPWGVEVERPEELVVLHDDAELASFVAGDRSVAVCLDGGDLAQAVGATGPRPVMQRVPVDLVHVELDDGRELTAVAHVVARRSWWRGPVVAVLNVDHVGRWMVAPRAHPNDGRLHVVEVDGSMPIRQRLEARRRLPQGTHVPHPAIHTRVVVDGRWELPRASRIVVDGVEVGTSSTLGVRVEPDAFELHV